MTTDKIEDMNAKSAKYNLEMMMMMLMADRTVRDLYNYT